jgi:hypothetical protein
MTDLSNMLWLGIKLELHMTRVVEAKYNRGVDFADCTCRRYGSFHAMPSSDDGAVIHNHHHRQSSGC